MTQRIEQLAEADVDAAAQRDDRRESRCEAAPRNRASPRSPRPIARPARAAPGSAAGAQNVAFKADVRADHAERTRIRQGARRASTRSPRLLRIQACAVGRVARIGRCHQHRRPAGCTALARSMMPATVAGGVAMIARSTGRPIAASDRLCVAREHSAVMRIDREQLALQIRRAAGFRSTMRPSDARALATRRPARPIAGRATGAGSDAWRILALPTARRRLAAAARPL